MDPRFIPLLGRLRATRFAELAGSDARATIRISDRLLNEAVSTFTASATAVRDISVHPRAGNHIDVQLKLARPSFLPPVNLTLHIERQPNLPNAPELVLRVLGAGGILRLAGPAIASSGALPPGVRLEGDRVLVDVRALAIARGAAELLEFVEQVQVETEDGALVLLVQAAVR